MTTIRPVDDVAETSPGRWKWVVSSRLHGRLAYDDAGPVSFATKDAAVRERKAHFDAPLDTTGRRVRSPEDLQQLIRSAQETCPDCNDAHFGGVYWHEPDETGCNWSVSTMRGSDWSACLACMQPIAIVLRQQYSLPPKQADQSGGP